MWRRLLIFGLVEMAVGVGLIPVIMKMNDHSTVGNGVRSAAMFLRVMGLLFVVVGGVGVTISWARRPKKPDADSPPN